MLTAHNWKASKAEIIKVLATLPAEQQFHYPIRHGTMRVGLYVPQIVDEQQPHTQDELYIIASGTGWLIKGEERIAFQAEDVLFVEAHIEHRFEGFSDDFATWVIFWGPVGGENEDSTLQ